MNARFEVVDYNPMQKLVIQENEIITAVFKITMINQTYSINNLLSADIFFFLMDESN